MTESNVSFLTGLTIPCIVEVGIVEVCAAVVFATQIVRVYSINICVRTHIQYFNEVKQRFGHHCDSLTN